MQVRTRLLSNGVRHWFYIENGIEVLHREEDLPAQEAPDGKIVYYKHGKMHRDNGPAYINPCAKNNQVARAFMWLGLRHNLNGPAIIRGNGKQEWHMLDKLHNYSGPAVLSRNNKPLVYALHGVELTKEDYESATHEHTQVLASVNVYSKFPKNTVKDHIIQTFDFLGFQKEKELLLDYSVFLK